MKANQPSLLAAIRGCVESSPAVDRWQEGQTTRGRSEQRQVALYPASPAASGEWAGLKWFVSVTRSGERQGRVYERASYYISSYGPATAAVLAEAIRGHWLIENQLHWQKDVSFREDSCRIRTGQGAENRSLLLNMAINLMRSCGFKSVKEATIALANKIDKMNQIIRT